MSDELVVTNPGSLYKQATDVAGVCRDIVLSRAIEIQGRRYVPVEPWMAIAVAHGCIAGIRSVERIEQEGDMFGGFRAVSELRRQSDGLVMATNQGFVGEDEPVWFGGKAEVWDKAKRKLVEKTYQKRPDFAIRAMAQTRAISRVCRSAFAHVVVLIDAQLDTTPAEEVLHDDSFNQERIATPAEVGGATQQTVNGDEKRWQKVACTYGNETGPLRGKLLGELTEANLQFLHGKFIGEGAPEKISEQDKPMVEGLKLWHAANQTEKTWS